MRVVVVLLALAMLPATASAKPLISYGREGGFRGTPLAMTCTVHGRCNSVEGVGSAANSFTLGKKALKRLRRSIKTADFDTLKTDYRPKPGTVADGFTERVTYHGKTVMAGTGGTAPPRLEQLLARLSALASSQ